MQTAGDVIKIRNLSRLVDVVAGTPRLRWRRATGYDQPNTLASLWSSLVHMNSMVFQENRGGSDAVACGDRMASAAPAWNWCSSKAGLAWDAHAELRPCTNDRCYPRQADSTTARPCQPTGIGMFCEHACESWSRLAIIYSDSYSIYRPTCKGSASSSSRSSPNHP